MLELKKGLLLFGSRPFLWHVITIYKANERPLAQNQIMIFLFLLVVVRNACELLEQVLYSFEMGGQRFVRKMILSK